MFITNNRFRIFQISALLWLSAWLAGCGSSALAPPTLEPTPTPPRITVILTDLQNPRGVAVGPEGELYVAEAGTGYDAADPQKMTGKLSVFRDLNRDGDFMDEGEMERWFSHLPTYNALQFFNSRRDEVNGPADVLLHEDGRVFLSVDGGLDKIALYEISPDGRIGRNLAGRSNMNSIAFNLDQTHIYAAASTANQLYDISLDGEIREAVTFPELAHGQQAVPAGVAVDPRNGDVLVALFSGNVRDPSTGNFIPFMPGDAKIVRVNPETGEFQDEITGLTTAVDVAIDEEGNIFTVEMASIYADLLPKLFDLFDPDAPPLHGGYRRFSGKITLYPADGGEPRVLADGLDMPTNITIGPDGELYVSVGQGTPGRPIPGPDGPTRIVGQVLRIERFDHEFAKENA
ncbi:MAG: hypothetical protein GXP42_12640 [Chloroflexi bacterium]|nr:hypothetical protein [Chloroflexota bacterium]